MLRRLWKYLLLATLVVAHFVVLARPHNVSSAERNTDATLLGLDTLLAVDPVAVTAVKHNSQLDKSAVTATVIDLQSINLKGISGVKDIVTCAPNFFMPDYGSRMTSSIYVRYYPARH